MILSMGIMKLIKYHYFWLKKILDNIFSIMLISFLSSIMKGDNMHPLVMEHLQKQLEALHRQAVEMAMEIQRLKQALLFETLTPKKGITQ